jgi:micrococcal nuclease
VIDTVDGDTFVARFADGHTETVRVLGVDTPETKDPRKPVQCFGPEASAYTHDRLLGRSVTLERDVELRDKYGRLLTYVYVDGRRFDDELLRLGYARLLVIAPNGEHARAMVLAELDARDHGRGLWGAC